MPVRVAIRPEQRGADGAVVADVADGMSELEALGFVHGALGPPSLLWAECGCAEAPAAKRDGALRASAPGWEGGLCPGAR